jgi:anaerobic selenocysteine-containing dehydrogenase
MIIRLAEGGNRFGLRRSGLTFNRLTKLHPHGTVVAPHLNTGVLGDVVVYRHGRVRLAHKDIKAEIDALAVRPVPEDYPMRLIGKREPRSENSWLHNSPSLTGPLLKRGGHIQRAVMHADDAAALGITDDDVVSVESPYGEIAVPVTLTSDIVRGTIAVPHGWGHKGTGGWQLANRAGGVNVNQLTSSDPGDVESLAGMAWLTGIPVRVRPTVSLSANAVE